MYNIQLISTNSELKHWLKKEKRHVFTYSTIKDGLRNLAKARVDVLIVDMNNARMAKGLWLKRLAAQKDLIRGELSLLLLTPQTYKTQTSFFDLVERFHVQDIFWYESKENILENTRPLAFFLKRNLSELKFKRANNILDHENQSLLAAMKIESSLQTIHNESPIDAPPLSFMNCNSEVTRTFLTQLEKNIALDKPKLLLGSVGLEQEQIAIFMHQRKNLNSKKPFISLDLKKIPEHLQEARLFGYKKDTLPSALRSGKGAIEQAHSGTIFISNIDSLEWNLQAKLLDCLGSREFSRIGERKKHKLRCQVILSSLPILEKRVEQGAFRQDLYYHIKIAPIQIPGLKQRRDDIIHIAENFCNWHNGRFDSNYSFSPQLKIRLSKIDWPGEIAQLYDFLSKFLALAPTNELVVDHLVHFEKLLLQQEQKSQIENMPVQLFLREGKMQNQRTLFSEMPSSNYIEPTIQELEREYIKQILANHNGNYSKTARILGITRKTLYDKVKKYTIYENDKLQNA